MDYGFSSELKPDDPRQEELAKQREERGFDDTETWCLFSSSAKFMIPRLRRFRKLTIAYPTVMTMKKWRKILKRIIQGFEESLRCDEADFDHKKSARGLRLFAKYYMHLWW